jgi:hypothetical protein
MIAEVESGHWQRFRIQWADFRNANRNKGSSPVKPSDLIRLPIDDKVKENIKTPDIEAVKKKFGPNVKKKNGKQQRTSENGGSDLSANR